MTERIQNQDPELEAERPAAQDPLGRLPGLLRDLAPKRPVSIEEMDEAIRRRTVEKQARAGRNRH